jgi:RNA polymerase sigma-70 factor (ECF subfamily)
LGTLEDAEEVLADTFVIVWNEIADYDPKRAPLATWIWMRAKYAALDRRRQLRRQRDTVPLLEGRSTSGKKQAGLDRADRWDLHSVLSTLPEMERELVYRRYFLQESLGEIAQQTQLSVHAVRNRLWRTRQKLAALIEAATEVALEDKQKKKEPSPKSSLPSGITRG